MRLVKLLSVVCLLALVVALPVAGSIAAHEGGPHVRIAHLSPTSPEVDVYVNGKMAVSKLAYKMVTEYLALEGYEFSVVIVPTGGQPATDSVTKETIKLKFDEGDGGYYTVAAVGSLADNTFAVILLPADGMPMPMAMNAEMGMAKVGDLEITNGFARATAGAMGGMGHGGHGGMGGVSAAYMTITNKGMKADRLIAVEAEIAGKIELHETKVENDIARMIPMLNGIEIPAGGKAELKPGGLHIMLMDLKAPLEAGKTLTLKLKFESGAEVTITLPIRSL
jgi:copper(I)-binding protein